MSKLHWSEGRQPGDVLWQTLCGQLVVETATNPVDVTCRKCKKHLRATRPSNASAAHYVAELWSKPVRELAPAPPMLDPLSGLPVLSPLTWHVVKDRRHWCGHCPTCVWFTQIKADAAASPWKKRHRLDSERHRWPSVSAALEWYAQQRTDGYAISAQNVSRIGKLGTIVSGGDRPDGKLIQEADDAHAIEQALSKCYLEHSKRGLSREARLFALFRVVTGAKPHEVARQLVAMKVAVTLSGPIVSGVVAAGKQVLYEQLRSRGMIPRR